MKMTSKETTAAATEIEYIQNQYYARTPAHRETMEDAIIAYAEGENDADDMCTVEDAKVFIAHFPRVCDAPDEAIAISDFRCWFPHYHEGIADRVCAYIRETATIMNMEDEADEYITEAEHQDGREVWVQFADRGEAFQDFARYAYNTDPAIDPTAHVS